MKRREKAWFLRPEKSPKPKVPDNVKAEVETKANELVESFLKPEHIKPQPEDLRFNYVVDIYTKWYRHYFYFCAKYACPAQRLSLHFLKQSLPHGIRWEWSIQSFIHETHRELVQIFKICP